MGLGAASFVDTAAGRAALLAEVSRRIAGVAWLARVVVFGSWGRGEPRPDSDLDLMVVTDQVGTLAERQAAIRSLLRGIGVPLDVVVYTREEYERLRSWRSSVAGIADREGILVHG